MKKLMLSTAILGAIATGAFAQGTDMSNPFRSAADPMMIPASDFIGMRVYASEAALDADEYAGLQDGWEDIGEINDVLLARDGTIDLCWWISAVFWAWVSGRWPLTWGQSVLLPTVEPPKIWMISSWS